jgi:nucleoside-diphosphate-sugar epimerase
MNKRKILITGKGSYIGTSFMFWLQQWVEQYEVVELSLRDAGWKLHDFSAYDVVLHVAGIAHVSTKSDMEQQYYKINRDLAIEVAKKAKKENVKQFIFMSSIIVYGDSSQINKERVIDRYTIPSPSNFYGDSKLQAEDGIRSLDSDKFKTVVLRPPMIYGKNSKGNYPKLSKAARKLPIFPDINNHRSMLYIDNLCEFIRLMIKNEERGMFFPQNMEYVKTSHMVEIIAAVHGKNIKLTMRFNKTLTLISSKIDLINKVFGNLIYDQSLSGYKENYRIKSLRESIIITEGDSSID